MKWFIVISLCTTNVFLANADDTGTSTANTGAYTANTGTSTANTGAYTANTGTSTTGDGGGGFSVTTDAGLNCMYETNLEVCADNPACYVDETNKCIRLESCVVDHTLLHSTLPAYVSNLTDVEVIDLPAKSYIELGATAGTPFTVEGRLTSALRVATSADKFHKYFTTDACATCDLDAVGFVTIKGCA